MRICIMELAVIAGSVSVNIYYGAALADTVLSRGIQLNAGFVAL